MKQLFKIFNIENVVAIRKSLTSEKYAEIYFSTGVIEEVDRKIYNDINKKATKNKTFIKIKDTKKTILNTKYEFHIMKKMDDCLLLCIDTPNLSFKFYLLFEDDDIMEKECKKIIKRLNMKKVDFDVFVELNKIVFFCFPIAEYPNHCLVRFYNNYIEVPIAKRKLISILSKNNVPYLEIQNDENTVVCDKIIFYMIDKEYLYLLFKNRRAGEWLKFSSKKKLQVSLDRIVEFSQK